MGRLLYNKIKHTTPRRRSLEPDRRTTAIPGLLSQKFPNPAQVSTEIINLNAILGLPKGTEHFISDIHGEYRLFLHILKNASGSVRRKIFQCFSEEEMSTAEMDELATLIYYPEEKLALLKEGSWLTKPGLVHHHPAAFGAGLPQGHQ